ncbi:MAG: hypothetical protein WBE86_10390 [Candidatus Acidiferrales bacterium]
MSNFRTGEDESRNSRVTTEELAKGFEGLTLALFNAKNGILEEHLEGQKVLFAMEASRHFRPPKGLGEMPFEGCALAIFKDNLGDRRDAFMKDAASVALRIQEIEGHKVAVFEEPSEQDTLTTFVTFPQAGVVLVATDEQFLRQVLSRMRDENGQSRRALPDALPEWKYVNKEAQFWGLRHYDRQQANEDPTSPFAGARTADPDDQAVALTYACDPSAAQKATLTYLSGPNADLKKIEQRRFPAASEPESTAGLHTQYAEIAPSVMQTTYQLDHSKPLDWFFFVLMGDMGHAIYL